MSAHDPHRTPAQAAPCESSAETALAHVMDAQALNASEALILLNPSPEVDSLAEEIAALDLPAHVRVRLLRRIADALQLNASEFMAEAHAAGLLDQLANSRVGLKRTAHLFGAHLDVLAAMRTGTPVESAAAVTARGQVRDLIASHDREWLLSPAFRAQLGARRHQVLAGLLGGAR